MKIAPGGTLVAVLSHALWTRRFGSDPRIIGKTISLSGEPYAIVGIVGPGFDVSEFGPPPDVWTPFQLDPHTSDQGHYFSVTGRLKPGVTLAQAQARLALAGVEYKQKYPNVLQRDQGFWVQRLSDEIVQEVRPTLWLLLGAVSFVLLIACANVANLLLVRATGRRPRDRHPRRNWRPAAAGIIRQLLTESVLLSLAGGIVGLGRRHARHPHPAGRCNTAGLPRVGEDGSIVSLDWRVLLFTLVVSISTGVIFGLIPALHASRADLSGTLKESSGRSGTGFRQNKTRSILVVAEVALALVLLIGSTLLVRTVVALRTVEPGFDVTNVLTMRMSMSGPRYFKSQGVDDVVRDGVARIKALPGVVEASATCCVPLEGGYGLPFIIVGRKLEQGPFHGGGGWLTVAPGYFEVFRIAAKQGRTFTDRDRAQSTPVVIINEAMARQYWPKKSPINERLIIGRGVMREFADEPSARLSASSATSGTAASTTIRSRRCTSRRRRCRIR
jgi:predicted permease